MSKWHAYAAHMAKDINMVDGPLLWKALGPGLFPPLNQALLKVVLDPERRSRLRQDSAFFFRTRIRNRSQKFVRKWARARSHFPVSAAAGVCVVIS